VTKQTRRSPPLDWGKLHPALVTSADRFSILQYGQKRSETPALAELEQAGKIPNMPAVLGDTAFALYAHEAGVKEDVPADRRYWRDLLGETTKTTAFKGLAAQTRSDWLLSSLGTIEAAREILRLVPKEDAKKLDDIAKAQAEADELEQEAQQAQGSAQGLEQLLAQMTAQAQAGGQMGGQLTAAQAQKLASDLAKAQVAAKGARELADLAKAEAHDKVNALLGQPGSAEAEAKLTELRRLGMGAMAKATEKVSETSDTIRAWGLEPGEMNKMPVPEALDLLGKMQRNADFKAFTKLLGRLKAMAKKKAKSDEKAESRQVPRAEQGRNLSRAVHCELVAFAAGGALRAGVLTRWAKGTLELRGAETKNTPKGKGPVVVCRDSSGSMSGTRQQWATGVHLSLASYAKVQKRAFGSIIFDTRVAHAKVFKAGRVGARDLLEIVETHTGGGTDFEAPLRGAMKMIDAEGLSKADIVFITDGECAVSEKFLTEFLAWKKAKEVTVIGIIVDDSVSDATVRKFADRTERASSFTAEEAENKVFAHL
jgi:uncharacterized protein with von Willebrand factor type A (vWA) domain